MVSSFDWAPPSGSITTQRLLLRPINPEADAIDVLRMRTNPKVTAYLYPRFAPTPSLSVVKSRLQSTLSTNTIFLAITLRTSAASPTFPTKVLGKTIVMPNHSHPTRKHRGRAHAKPTAWLARDPPAEAPSSFTDRSAQIVIGTVGITSSHELGYVLDEPYWGMGLGAEAVSAAVELWQMKVARQTNATGQSVMGQSGQIQKLRQLKAVSNLENVSSMKMLEKCGFEKVLLREAEDWNDVGATVEMWEWRLGRKALGEGGRLARANEPQKIRLVGNVRKR